MRRAEQGSGQLAGHVGLAVSGALLLVAAAPPFDAWPLALAGWVPLALLAAEATGVRAFMLGWLEGALVQVATLGSVLSGLHHASGASLAGAAAMAAALFAFEGARFGVVAVLAARMVRNDWSLTVAFPLALVSTEAVYPMLFPWGTWLFFHRVPVLLQVAEIGGPLAVSLWAAIVNGCLAEAWRERRRGRRLWLGLVVPAAIVVAVIAFGEVRMRTIASRVDAAEQVTVGVVQGGPTGRDRTADRVSAYRAASLDLLDRGRVDLLVWPEASVSDPTPSEDVPRLLSTRILHRGADRPIDVPLLFGAAIDRADPRSAATARALRPDGTRVPEARRRYNSAVLAMPDGIVRGVYEKRDLVAGGEWIPGEERFPWLRRLLPSAGAFSPGTSSAPLVLRGKRILVSVCYEDILWEHVRAAFGESEPDMLVNLTSDAWFDSPRVAALHLGLAKLRAVEHRRYLVHAAASGSSAVVDPLGRTVAELPTAGRASEAVSLRWLTGGTVYGACGRVLWIPFAGACAVLLVRRRRGYPEAMSQATATGHRPSDVDGPPVRTYDPLPACAGRRGSLPRPLSSAVPRTPPEPTRP